jgi:hypothetical protein
VEAVRQIIFIYQVATIGNWSAGQTGLIPSFLRSAGERLSFFRVLVLFQRCCAPPDP